MYWPSFENATLESFVFALKKRSRTLKHKTKKISCERVVEKENDRKVEKLELRLQLIYPSKCAVSIFIWEDRWLWIDIRKPSKKGWDFEWSDEGRLVNDSAQDILAKLENTIELIPNSTTGNAQTIWSKVLAKGPRLSGEHF